MKIKDLIKKQQLDIMKLRARGMSTKPRSAFEDDIKHLSELLMSVTNQRDRFAIELTEHIKVMNDQAARIVDLQAHIENLEGEE